MAGAFFAVDFLAVDFAAVDFLAAAFFAGAAFFAPFALAAVLSLGSFFAPDTTAFSSAPGLNFGTAVFLALIRSPVRGLRPSGRHGPASRRSRSQ